MARADYKIVGKSGHVVYLVDLDRGNLSVTNDAEEVVSEILSLYPIDSVIVYRDSAGSWDELLHDGFAFTGFRSWQGPVPEIA